MPAAEWPQGVREYLATRDQLARAQLRRDDPGLDARLGSAEALAAATRWLGEDAAANETLTLGCLELLAAHPQDADPAVIRALVIAGPPMLRRAAYEVLFARHFRAGDREALAELITSMLRDPSDNVRRAVAAYAERAGLRDDLLPLLRRWLTAAAAQGWQDSESYELVTRLVEGR